MWIFHTRLAKNGLSIVLIVLIFSKASTSSFNQMLRMVTQRYDDLLNILPSQVGEIDLPDLPDLSHISRAVPRNGFFGAFLPTHRKAVLEVRDMMQGETFYLFNTSEQPVRHYNCVVHISLEITENAIQLSKYDSKLTYIPATLFSVE